jgi:DNA-damage-inducible protein J
MSATDAVVRARVGSDLKEKASAALAEMGLSVSDAIRLMLVRVAADRALPFEIRTPNPQTVAALKAAEAGDTVKFTSVEALLADLDADD